MYEEYKEHKELIEKLMSFLQKNGDGCPITQVDKYIVELYADSASQRKAEGFINQLIKRNELRIDERKPGYIFITLDGIRKFNEVLF